MKLKEKLRGFLSAHREQIFTSDGQPTFRTKIIMLLISVVVGALVLFSFGTLTAGAAELVTGNELVTPYDNYLITSKGIYANYTVDGNEIRYNNAIGTNMIKNDYVPSYMLDYLRNGTLPATDGERSNSIFTDSTLNIGTIYFSSEDLYTGSGLLVFRRTPYLTTSTPTVAGVTAETMAKTVMEEVVGLLPLVIGLVVLALALWKGLAFLLMRLRTA